MSEPSEERPERSTLREYTEAILIAAIFLAFTNVFVMKTFYIPSSSMEDTLLIGDHLFVNRFVFGPTATSLERSLLPHRPVQRGDIVIFRSPEDPTLDVVKRCVAVGGDVVEIVDKRLYINGEEVEDDSYTEHRDPFVYRDLPAYSRQQRRRDNMEPYTVPEDHYFCMGDNRDRSYDSRYWGPLPAHLVKGRASMIYWSDGGEVSDGSPADMSEQLARLGRNVLEFFTKTRWGRTGHLPR